MDGNGILLVRNLSKIFETEKRKIAALEDINREVKRGEFLALVGPSGCGKSTLLRLIAGLDLPSRGEIIFNGKKVSAPGAERGMIFQEYALFPWRATRKNIEFGLEIKGMPKEERRRIVQHYVELVGLKGFEEAYPGELSGGMKQRVGIARVLANSPEVLLMDEPFGSLDALTRNYMQKELTRIWEKEKKTILFVTHSVDEAVYLADRVVILTARPGRVKKIISVNLTRPRIRASSELSSLRLEVLEELENEIEATIRLEEQAYERRG